MLLSILFSFFLHPYFVSQSNLFYETTTQELQITSQYFLDDFEKALSQYYQGESIVITRKESIAQKEKIKKYLLSKMKISIDDSTQTIDFLGYELEHGNIICYLVVPNTKTPQRNLSFSNSVLYQTQEQQTHLIQLQIGKQEWNARIRNPVQKYQFKL